MNPAREQPDTPTPDSPLRADAALRESILAMTATLALAEGLVEAGRRIDLAGLDAEVGAICAAALGLARDDAIALRPQLIDLRDRVERLALRLAPP